MSDSTEKSFKKTLNLPKTDFPIRAGLAQKEPELVRTWAQEDAFSIRHTAEEKSSTSFILHDGPPYPNGNIHMGHALNKILKDMIVRYNSMSGHRTHYVPGWDCHGLPIETQVIKELKSNGQEEKKNDVSWFRKRCKEFALEYVDTQKEDFQHLGIWADWKHPYLTLTPDYERHVIRLFGQMAENGLIYKGRKPIHWCMHCETALAEAEIEYHNHRSPSIFVKFTTSKPSESLKDLIGDAPAHVLVWTTTPWTLPSNVAVAAHPDFTYAVIRHGDQHYIVVENLLEKLSATLEWDTYELIGTIKGADLNATETKHPFIKRTSAVVNATYVSDEDGTGFVHIAPGHGQDDYIVGKELGLDIIMPVDDSGRYTQQLADFGDTTKEWVGQKVLEANRPICEHMSTTGVLEKLIMIKHSYPHCWRCKNPVIFRATEQWFVAMDTPTLREKKSLRDLALNAISEVKWVPDWGETRIRTMVQNRPDWCISRQRYWGIPIPVFNCDDCGHSEMTGEFNEAVQTLVAEHGTLAWFEKDTADILPSRLKCSKCGSQSLLRQNRMVFRTFRKLSLA
jgi:isoleucyl-tRNA synthetase